MIEERDQSWLPLHTTPQCFPYRQKSPGLVLRLCSLSQTTGFVASPLGVILLRILALLICSFMIAASFCKLPDKSNSPGDQQTLSGGVIPNKPTNESKPNEQGTRGPPAFQDLLALLPDQVTENARVVWQHGRDNQIVVVSLGLLTCLTAIFLAGPVR